MKKILIIEDDATMRQALRALLAGANYDVVILEDFSTDAFCETIRKTNPDLVLLDLNLPDQNGLNLLKTLREFSDVSVIMVTSSSDEANEVLSMSYGADDYITKPYSPSILLLRIAAVLRRTEMPAKFNIVHGLKIDLTRGLITKEHDEHGDNTPKTKNRILLTKNEMIILRHLLEHQGEIVKRDELMTDLWNNQEYINDNALTVNVSRLRNKLAMLSSDEIIETRKGLGYILV